MLRLKQCWSSWKCVVTPAALLASVAMQSWHSIENRNCPTLKQYGKIWQFKLLPKEWTMTKQLKIKVKPNHWCSSLKRRSSLMWNDLCCSSWSNDWHNACDTAKELFTEALINSYNINQSRPTSCHYIIASAKFTHTIFEIWWQFNKRLINNTYQLNMLLIR